MSATTGPDKQQSITLTPAPVAPDRNLAQTLDAGQDPNGTLCIDDPVPGDDCLVVSGVTDREIVPALYFEPGGWSTRSLVMRSRSGTIREVRRYKLDTLRACSSAVNCSR